MKKNNLLTIIGIGVWLNVIANGLSIHKMSDNSFLNIIVFTLLVAIPMMVVIRLTIVFIINKLKNKLNQDET